MQMARTFQTKLWLLNQAVHVLSGGIVICHMVIIYHFSSHRLLTRLHVPVRCGLLDFWGFNFSLMDIFG